MQVAFTLYLIVLFPGGPPVVTNTGDVAERLRLQERSGSRRLRGQKHARRTASINLVHVRAEVRIRAARTEALKPPLIFVGVPVDVSAPRYRSGPVPQLAQDEKSRSTRREAGGGRRLGAMTKVALYSWENERLR